MKLLLKNAQVFLNKEFKKSDISIENDYIINIAPAISEQGFDNVYNLNNLYIFPGLVDVHTHLREPGFLYKETIYKVKSDENE